MSAIALAAAEGLLLAEEPLLAAVRPVDLAESFRDLPGMVLLESARPGRRARWSYLVADPVAVIDRPADGPDPFAEARALLARLAPAPDEADDRRPPFTGGLAGYLSYDLARVTEQLPSRAADDQPLPLLRLGLYDWAICWDRQRETAWLAVRVLDGDEPRADRRRAWVEERIRQPPPAVPDAGDEPPLSFASAIDAPGYRALVEAVRAEIARGEVYQVNVARRLAAPFSGDPWLVHRRLRTGDPASFAAYIDLGGEDPVTAPRAIASASPEPFLSVDRRGVVTTDPIKGTRRRGRTRCEDRRLAAELLASEKDRAENTMIVDVLRNDLGRVCAPGSVRVPRLCRLERTATVQHLVSTVTGRLAPGRDAFDLFLAAFPGGSITGAPKLRAMELIEELEPVRRGPYTGCAVWFGADGAVGSSILIRTFVADGERLTLHVGGGITWRSDPEAEWDETRAKAAGPLGALGATEA